MQTGSLARRYAKAIFGLGQAQKVTDTLAADLRSLAKAMSWSVERAAWNAFARR